MALGSKIEWQVPSPAISNSVWISNLADPTLPLSSDIITDDIVTDFCVID
jgi:hypothetical protein